MKTCTRCKRSKPVEEFYARAECGSAPKSQCKECDSIRMRLYYQANREKIRAQQRLYQKENGITGSTWRMKQRLRGIP